MKLPKLLPTNHSYRCRAPLCQTELISLKSVSGEDAPRVLALLTPDISTPLAISPVTNLAQARQFLLGEGTTHKERYGVWHSQAGLIGTLGYGLREGQVEPSAEISYWLGTAWQGQGYGREALKLLIKHLNKRGVYRYSAQVYGFNIPSQRILQKLGFHCSGANAGVGRNENMLVLNFCRTD